MPKILRLQHDEHFDLLVPEDAPKGAKSVGTVEVLTRGGDVETRGKYLMKVPGNDTVIELADDYDAGDLQAVTDLVSTLVARHSDAVKGVSGSDPALTAKVAALLGAEVLQEDK